MPSYKDRIDKIEGVYNVAVKTPINFAKKLSQSLQNEIFIKREDLQEVYSFKLRGAYNKIENLTAEQKSRGIIAASAGNHAQGVALASSKLNIPATIVMPVTTPEIKVSSVRSLGAKVILFGDTFNESCNHTLNNKDYKDLTFIHPYDDIDVILGQGTIGREIYEQKKDIEYVFIPVGGGGLIAGVAAYLKEANPNIKIIGVEPEDAACLKEALNANERVILPKVGIFADGVAVNQIGKHTFEFCKKYVDDVITVTTDEICAGVKDSFDNTRAIAEPAGALALAGLKKYLVKNGIKNKKCLTIQSGANVNFDRLRHISERAEIGEKRESIFAITLKEEKGSLLILCSHLLDCNITEFNYRHANKLDANIFIGIQSTPETRKKLFDIFKNRLNYPVQDLTDNEIAKVHIRHTVGGRNRNLGNEFFYSFQFPERPNALVSFLSKMQMRWNISMFHYRNHGADFGRVLMGVQAEQNEKQDLEKFFLSTNYHYQDETDNIACKFFLK